MSGVVDPVVSWEAFQELPSSEHGERFELRDGVVAAVPVPDVLRLKLQFQIQQLLRSAAHDPSATRGRLPYRPMLNLQFWYADVALVPRVDWQSMPLDEFPIYVPPMIVEVLSPSNPIEKVRQQRMVALSAGTQEFWIVDTPEHVVVVTDLSTATVYASGETIPATAYHAAIAVDDIFNV
jgi:Uma2 family endonuclease